MDLEQLLREARPEAAPDLSEQNELICEALRKQADLTDRHRRSWLGRCGTLLLEAPIPTLTAAAAVLSFFLWQAAVLLGEDGLWIGQAAAFILNKGVLP